MVEKPPVSKRRRKQSPNQLEEAFPILDVRIVVDLQIVGRTLQSEHDAIIKYQEEKNTSELAEKKTRDRPKKTIKPTTEKFNKSQKDNKKMAALKEAVKKRKEKLSVEELSFPMILRVLKKSFTKSKLKKKTPTKKKPVEKKLGVKW
ncbi:hypothetical protein CASFOL_017292 [Castilleja foliolosa]|uniref:Uncharacterized protein n=1 Tax=Castilleja foliolosa TaxID=1961234 RepID=A0ABD3DEX9_9LAMI